MGKSSKLIKAFLESVRGLKPSQKEKSGSLNHGNAELTCNHPATDDGDYNRVEVKKEKRRWRSFGKSASINRSSGMVLLMQPGAVQREQQRVPFEEELPDQVNLGRRDLYTKSRGAAVADCYTDISCIIIDEKLPLAKLKRESLKNAAATGNEEINSAGVILCREKELTVDKMLDKSIVFLASDRLDWAAARIQTAFRGYLARRAFRALKGLVRLQALARGRRVRKQAAATLRCVHALVRLQARIRAHQVRISEQGQAVQRRLHMARVKRQLQQQHGQQQAAAAATAASPSKPSMVIDPQHEWDCSPATTEQLQAKIQYRQVAAMRRERALAYAFSEQLRRCAPKGGTPFVIDCSSKSDKDNQWGWSWLERWMAAKPWQRGSFNPGLAREHVSVMNVMDETANTINNINHIKPVDHRHHHHHHDITDESKISPYHHQQYHVDKNLFINKDQDHAVYIKKRSLSIPEIMLNNIDSLLSQLNDQPASAIHMNAHKNASPTRSSSTFPNDATNLPANPSSPAAHHNHPRISKPAVNCVQRSPTSQRQATGSNNIIKKQLPLNSSGQDQINTRSRAGTSQLAVDAVNDNHRERKARSGCNYDHNDSMNDEAAVRQSGLMVGTAASATTPPTTPNKGANYNHGAATKASSFNHWKAMATLSNKASLIEQQSHHSEPWLVINDVNRIRAVHNYGDSVNATAAGQLPSYMQSTHSAKAKSRAAGSPRSSQSSAATRSTSPAGQSTPAAKSLSPHLTSPKAKNDLSNASVINGVSPPPKRRNSISSTHSISTAAPAQPSYIASSNRVNSNLIDSRIAISDHHHHQRLIATKSSRGFSSSATSDRLVEMEVV